MRDIQLTVYPESEKKPEFPVWFSNRHELFFYIRSNLTTEYGQKRTFSYKQKRLPREPLLMLLD
jgi:hypothetical protein